MNLLVFNCGSSSQGFTVFTQSADGEPLKLILGKARNVATPTKAEGELSWTINGQTRRQSGSFPDHRTAAEAILNLLQDQRIPIDAIAHRFVNGGSFFQSSALLDEAAMSRLKACLPLAPIHNPNSYSVIEVCRKRLPALPQYAVFDTAFHKEIPPEAAVYGLPRDLARQKGYHKIGFHGLSYQYVSGRAACLLKRPLAELRLILCHLGTGGSSVCAMRDGHSCDTSMGYSPLSGLIMSTRCGDLDPQIVLDLIQDNRTPDEVSDLLNHRSGLLGISAFSSNLGEIITEAEKGNADCQLAYDAYVLRLRKAIGAFLYELNGADALIFTDDAGERFWKMRERVCAQADFLGIRLDAAKNRSTDGSSESCISATDSRISVWVIPTDEERTIYDEILN